MDRLKRLREVFLGASEGKKVAGPYWRDREDLALYDRSLGKRISWKWKTVFAEFERVGLAAPTGRVLDFGCGAGAVGEALLGVFPNPQVELFVSDHSELAVNYTREKLKALGTKAWTPNLDDTWDWIFVSHVLNELNPSAQAQLVALLRRSRHVVLVEPGTKRDFQRLLEVRGELLGDFRALAPCTHSRPCPLLNHADDWCHHFAEVPNEVFRSSEWSEYQNTLHLDLSSVPFSYLVLQNKSEPIARDLESWDRVLGTPRMLKATARILSCQASEGARELELQKRDDPGLFKAVKRGEFPRLVEWIKSADGKRIAGIKTR